MTNWKNTFILTAMLLIAMSGLVSANSMNNEFQTIQSESTESTNMTFQTVVNTLYAGQNINVGTLNISNDCQNLTVTYEMAGNWTLQETHLEIATSFESIPMTKSGNPVIGHFTYKNEELPEGSIIDTYVIPVNGKNGTVYIAAHAVVSNQNSDEGAWASGTQFPGDNWATYFTYDIINCAKEEIDQEDNEGDDGEDNEGNDGEDNEGGDGEDNEGNDGEDNEGNDGEDNEGNDGEDNEGNEGEDNEGDTNNGKKSGSSGSARVSEVSETTSEDNNAYMSTPQEEEPQPPVMSVAEPVHETKEQRILVLLAEKGSNLLWILIAMLLSGIWIMSGYGLTHP